MKPESVRPETEFTQPDGPPAPASTPTQMTPTQLTATQMTAAQLTSAQSPLRTEYAPEVWTVDGIEPTPHGPVARLERPDGRTVDRPLTQLPPGLREGDLLAVDDGPDGLSLRLLADGSAARRAASQATLDALNEQGRDPSSHLLSENLPVNVPVNDDGEIDL
ncbi:DUF3006 domain-containing protein [Deinococcus sp.]|uniref:DUF3006 domain-containing protein n=1 Tax=Deinococcus sp. TaxID=47478 RepID=UPI0025BAE636|nr:DUF3006 domain-containing protein [Deinococcus sp.]